MKKTLLTLATTLMAISTFASQPLRRYVTRTTDDGVSVTVARYGSQDFSWWEDAEGVRYSYDAASHQLKLMNEESFHEGLQTARGEEDRQGPRRALHASTENGLGEFGKSGMGVVNSIGSPTVPVLMVAFSDLDFLPGNDEKKIERFLNEEGYHDERLAVGSVADYFRHCSYGAFTPRFEVVGKVTLPNGYKYYGARVNASTADARAQEAVMTAVSIAEEQGINFTKYAENGRAPLISILYAGPGNQEDWGLDSEDYLWAHFMHAAVNGKTVSFNSYLMTNESMRDFDNSYNLVNEYMTGIGTFCHEFSHALGIPDFYDVTGGKNGVAETPGYWDIMDYQFMYNGYRPMEYSAYERSMMGWIKVEDLNKDVAEKLYILTPLSKDNSPEGKMYRIVNPANPNEYLLLENRQRNLFYADNLLGSGMLAWYIRYDSGKWSTNRVNSMPSEQHVHVIPADGLWQSKWDLSKLDDNNCYYTYVGDPFPGYANVTTLDKTLDKTLSEWFDETIRNIAVDKEGNVTFRYGNITTGIGADETDKNCATDIYYDLQGRRLQGCAGKGVYIKNDKIIINK